MSGGFRVLVLGGYGNFGAVIADALARIDGIAVIVAGRDAERARAHAARIGASSARIDASDAALASHLSDSSPQLVISTAGPFQGQDYAVARASIGAGAHYVDIADGRDFVCGIAALDAEAKSRGRLVVSGASSVPALSSAVVDRFAGEFAELREIDIGISASGKMPGLATVASVLGYCGKPVAQWRGGRWVRVHGWQGLRRHRFRDPAMGRWICDCDVPDLALLPTRYPGVGTVRFGAGVELAPVQMGLWLLALAVRARIVLDAARWARPLRATGRALEVFGSGRSAMFVRLSGVGRDGSPSAKTWELAAAGNDGVHVPCMAAVALSRKMARGEISARGAMPCVGLVTLEEYLAELKGLHINAQIH